MKLFEEIYMLCENKQTIINRWHNRDSKKTVFIEYKNKKYKLPDYFYNKSSNKIPKPIKDFLSEITQDCLVLIQNKNIGIIDEFIIKEYTCENDINIETELDILDQELIKILIKLQFQNHIKNDDMEKMLKVPSQNDLKGNRSLILLVYNDGSKFNIGVKTSENYIRSLSFILDDNQSTNCCKAYMSWLLDNFGFDENIDLSNCEIINMNTYKFINKEDIKTTGRININKLDEELICKALNSRSKNELDEIFEKINKMTDTIDIRWIKSITSTIDAILNSKLNKGFGKNIVERKNGSVNTNPADIKFNDRYISLKKCRKCTRLHLVNKRILTKNDITSFERLNDESKSFRIEINPAILGYDTLTLRLKVSNRKIVIYPNSSHTVKIGFFTDKSFNTSQKILNGTISKIELVNLLSVACCLSTRQRKCPKFYLTIDEKPLTNPSGQ